MLCWTAFHHCLDRGHLRKGRFIFVCDSGAFSPGSGDTTGWSLCVSEQGLGARGRIMVGVHVRASVVGVLILSQEGEREKGMCEWVNGAGRTGWDSTVPSKAYP